MQGFVFSFPPSMSPYSFPVKIHLKINCDTLNKKQSTEWEKDYATWSFPSCVSWISYCLGGQFSQFLIGIKIIPTFMSLLSG